MKADRSLRILLALSVFLSSFTGCVSQPRIRKHQHHLLGTEPTQGSTTQRCGYQEPAVNEPPATRQISTPAICNGPDPTAADTTLPLTVESDVEPEDWPLSLEQVIQITLQNSDVIRDLGGRLVTTPQASTSIYDVALQEVDPQFGVEAALSAFDAQLASSMIFDRDEQAFNNQFFGGGASVLSSNVGDFNVELSKRAATGTQFFLRNVTNYNRNDSPANLFRSAYNTQLNAEFRHPLLRGSGIAYNRIAGPNAQPGNYNGVVLARIRTDIALADFETSVRNLIRDVETAYWQLYFAYRSLDARTAAYDAALASWRTVQKRYEASTVDGEQAALARANYYRALAGVKNALGGGSANSGVVGVYSSERSLRKLMGVRASDGRLILPTDEPSTAKRIFDWQESLHMGLARRVELRRQRWTVKQRENELLAAKNFLLSQLDLIGLYRYRGFGDDLLGNRDVDFGSAFSDLYGGDLQGWQLGLQYSVALGKRREHATVRAAELQLSRERAVLRNQELDISSNIANQFAELDRAYAVARVNFNRTVAERKRFDAAVAKYKAGTELLEFVLQAQQNTADADTEYYRSLVDYTNAVMNFHYERGTYLEYMNVDLAEGPWSPGAYSSYAKEFRRFKPKMNYCMTSPPAVSRGTLADSRTDEAGMMINGDGVILEPGYEMSYPDEQAQANSPFDQPVLFEDTPNGDAKDPELPSPEASISTQSGQVEGVGDATQDAQAVEFNSLDSSETGGLDSVLIDNPEQFEVERPDFNQPIGNQKELPVAPTAEPTGAVDEIKVPTSSETLIPDLDFSKSQILNKATKAVTTAADAMARIVKAEKAVVESGPSGIGTLESKDNPLRGAGTSSISRITQELRNTAVELKPSAAAKNTTVQSTSNPKTPRIKSEPKPSTSSPAAPSQQSTPKLNPQKVARRPFFSAFNSRISGEAANSPSVPSARRSTSKPSMRR